jgi:hypothetical protein
VDAAAGSVARFQHNDIVTRALQLKCSDEPAHPRTKDNHAFGGAVARQWFRSQRHALSASMTRMQRYLSRPSREKQIGVISVRRQFASV